MALETYRIQWFPRQTFKETEAWYVELSETLRACANNKKWDASSVSEFQSFKEPLIQGAIAAHSQGAAVKPTGERFDLWLAAFYMWRECALAIERGDQAFAVTMLSCCTYAAAHAESNGHMTRKEILASVARKAVEGRHAKTRALKSEVQAWYKANGARYHSMASAAEAAAGMFQLTYATVYGYIREARKAELALARK